MPDQRSGCQSRINGYNRLRDRNLRDFRTVIEPTVDVRKPQIGYLLSGVRASGRAHLPGSTARRRIWAQSGDLTNGHVGCRTTRIARTARPGRYGWREGVSFQMLASSSAASYRKPSAVMA